MLLYTMLFSRLVYPLKMCFLKNPNDDMQWFTSDNPVVVSQNFTEDNIIQILGIDSEIFLPLSPKYLLYLCHPGSKLRNNFRNFDHQSINFINENDIDFITKTYIIPNTYEFLIAPKKI
jgi:hypothetical protein